MLRNSEQEQFRHECEVRHILTMQDVKAMKLHMDGCETRRGKKAADRLRRDVKQILIERRKASEKSNR